MLSEERIKELKLMSEMGEKAEEKLNMYSNLQDELECLKKAKDSFNKCYRVTYDYENRNGRILEIHEKEKVAELMKQIIQVEIDCLETELKNFE